MANTNRSTARPIYRELADQLIGDIDAGRVSIGDRLPGELEMVDRYQVSRFTIREALRILEERGFISRQRGKGTVVTSDMPSQTYRQKISSFDEMLQHPPDTKRKLISTAEVKCDPFISGLLECECEDGSETTCIRYSLLRTGGDGVPLCWQDIYLPDPMQKFGRWLNSGDGMADPKVFREIDHQIQKVRVEICPGHVQDHMADALQAKPDSPTICIVRRFISTEDRPMSVSVSEYPEGRYTFVADFVREWRAE